MNTCVYLFNVFNFTLCLCDIKHSLQWIIYQNPIWKVIFEFESRPSDKIPKH